MAYVSYQQMQGIIFVDENACLTIGMVDVVVPFSFLIVAIRILSSRAYSVQSHNETFYSIRIAIGD